MFYLQETEAAVMTDSTMTEIPLWDRLEAGANSIAVDGTPSQVGPTAEELHQAAAMLKAAVEALEEARRDMTAMLDRIDTIDECPHPMRWHETLDKIDNTLASLKQPGGR